MEEQQKNPVVASADRAGHMRTYNFLSDEERVPELGDAFTETNQDVNPNREVEGRSWPLVIGVTLLLLFFGLWIGRYMIL